MGSKVRIRGDVVCRQVQEEEVILDLLSGTYFGLNPVGTRIWEWMKKGLPLEKILAKVVREFEVEEPAAKSDLLALTKKLQSRELIELI
jgi:hypothetical protein